MNLILAALPTQERQRLEPFLAPLQVKLKDVLLEAGEPIRYVYFPMSCLVSVIYSMKDGATVETGIIGCEGFIGINAWLGQRSSVTRAFVQVNGEALRMRADVFQREVVQAGSPLNEVLASYTSSFLTITAITAACNRIHHIEQRLCRWLKMVHNRVPGNQFPMRHEFLAYMLGVHRPSVTIAANQLRAAGLIHYVHGRLEVLDPERLAANACECYAVMEAQFEKVVGRSLHK